MYSVSEAYLTQMMKKATRRRLTGTVGNVAFTSNDIVRNSFNVTGKAADESDTKIGGVYLGEINLTFVPSFLTKVARDQYEGKALSISIGLWVPNDEIEAGGAWVDVPIGIYTLQAPKISKQGITVNGYDNLQKADKAFSMSATSATPYGFLNYMATECGLVLGQTQAQIEALPNGTEVLALYEENDIETYRDMLYWIAQACACFACADRQGRIVLRRFGASNEIAFDENHRDTDVIFSGYTTKWTGISVVDIQNQTTKYYGLEVDDGLTMNLGSNPFLQLGTADAKDRRMYNILNAVAEIQYTPFYMNSARDPIFDLGDEIPFTGGISGGCTGCVMAYTYSLDNYSFEGYGDNPALANGRSKTDKNIAGLMQSTVENEVTYYNFTNLDAINIRPETETTIVSMAFTAAQTTTVKILHEFLFDMVKDLTIDGSYELHYYLDNELVAYKPRESLSGIVATTQVPVIPDEGEEPTTEPVQAEIEPVDLSITRDFFYVIRNVVPNQRHSWVVKIITHGITSTQIGIQNAHVVIEGQRLYGESYFDGFVEVKEDINRFAIFGIDVKQLTETINILTPEATIIDISDNIILYEINGITVKAFTESVSAMMAWIGLITEDGDDFITEDGEDEFTVQG